MAEPLTRWRFSVDDYHRMVEAGVLTEDDRVELLRGEIVVMAPIGSRHAACVCRLTRIFSRLGEQAVVSVQNPVRLADSEPEPDLGLHAPREDLYAARHPGPDDVLLLVEVADTTQFVDREVKGPLYAENGIREYWLVDLEAERVEVHREPGADGYRSVRRLDRGDRAAPLAFPDFEVAVADVLP